jgi:hypothetical protein
MPEEPDSEDDLHQSKSQVWEQAVGVNLACSMYKALLKRRDGSVAEILPNRVDRITGNATSLNLSKAKALFPSVASTLESPVGPIQLLIGMDHMEEAPREVEMARG